MKKTLFREAVRIARDKLTSHPQLGHFMHYSFIVQNNKIIEWGFNIAHEPPKHYGYHERLKDAINKPKMHSEIACYQKAKGLLNKNKKFEIINIRLDRNGELLNSAPCSCCHNLLTELGCHKFFFSSQIGFLEST